MSLRLSFHGILALVLCGYGCTRTKSDRAAQVSVKAAASISTSTSNAVAHTHCQGGVCISEILPQIERVSVGRQTKGSVIQSNGNSYNWRASTSSTGSFVAFESDASNLVASDTNGCRDVFIYERAKGELSRVSVSSAGAEANQNSSYPVVSADGRYVAFHSSASNLVAGDTNAGLDVFLRDRGTAVTERLSVSSTATQANGDSVWPAMSADGRYAAFLSAATNLVSGDTNGRRDVFVRDRLKAVTERVSVSSSGAQGNDACDLPDISADGRQVVFPSLATNLVAGDSNGHQDVFVRDRLKGVTQLVSVSSAGVQANADSFRPVISADGRYVAFSSAATNLTAGNPKRLHHVFVHDLVTGATTLASGGWNRAVANDSSYEPAISGDGHYVVFYTFATNLMGGDTNSVVDLVVHDRTTGVSEPASVAADGTAANRHSFRPAICADGRLITFSSSATNLVAGDTNGWDDVFIAPNPLW